MQLQHLVLLPNFFPVIFFFFDLLWKLFKVVIVLRVVGFDILYNQWFLLGMQHNSVTMELPIGYSPSDYRLYRLLHFSAHRERGYFECLFILDNELIIVDLSSLGCDSTYLISIIEWAW